MVFFAAMGAHFSAIALPAEKKAIFTFAKSKSLKECLEIEYQLSQHMVYRNDFNNGVESVLVSKNHQPQWSPSTIDEINYDEVNKMFEPHVKKLYL